MHSDVLLRTSIVCRQVRELVQGNCTKPLRSKRWDPPLEPFNPGQCLLEAEWAHFTFVSRPSPASVWFSNLYLRAFSREQKVETLLSFGPESATTLWLTNITTQGGAIGLLSSATMFVAGAPKPISNLYLTLYPATDEQPCTHAPESGVYDSQVHLSLQWIFVACDCVTPFAPLSVAFAK